MGARYSPPRATPYWPRCAGTPGRRLQSGIGGRGWPCSPRLLLAACSSGPSTPKAGPTTTHHDVDLAHVDDRRRRPRLDPGAGLHLGPVDAGRADRPPVLGRPGHRRREPRRRRVRRAAGSDQPRAGRRLGRRRQRPRRHRRARATGIAALAADGTNFYVATYCDVYAYNRASGNQDGQWTMPAVNTANSSNDDLVALAAAGGKVFVSVTRGNTVSVYSVDPATSAAPHLLVRGLGDAIGPDGAVYYESARPPPRRAAPRRVDRHGSGAGPHAQRAGRRRAVRRRRRRRRGVGQQARRPGPRCASSPPTTPPRSHVWAPTAAR